MDYKLKNFTVLVVMLLMATSGIVLFQNQGIADNIQLSQSGEGAGYLRWDGIEGEAVAAKHEDEIEILSWSWGATQPGSSYSGTSRRRGTVIFSDISIVKELDKSSPKLFEYLAMGRVTSEVRLFLTASYAGSERETYLEFIFVNVIITSFLQTGGVSTGSAPLESFTFSFEQITIIYTEYDESGSSKGNSEVVWNVEEGSAEN